MAYLVDSKYKKKYYLNLNHSFGRLPYSVDIVIPRPEISKIHALIEWDGTNWNIRDISRNGTWLNHQKLEENRRYPLKLNDSLCFSKNKTTEFLVKDLSAPADYLITADNEVNNLGRIHILEPYNIFPTENTPEIVLHFDRDEHRWCARYTDGDDESARYLEHDDFVRFDNKTWQLKINRFEPATENLNKNDTRIANVRFIFEVSQDEENTALKLQLKDKIYNLGFRSHHYLTLFLARQRAKDAKSGFDTESQGWVYVEDLTRDMDLDMTHINIHIHRARKQCVETLNNVPDGDKIVQRRPGQIRFGGKLFKIYKGSQLEFCSELETATEEIN